MTDPERDPAEARWLIIQLVRAVGVGFVLVGLLHTAGRVAVLGGIPLWFGYILIGIGLVDAFVVTRMLARRWRSPGE